MTNPFLSIVVAFCDKDFCYVENLCNQINRNVKPEHEIILVDNRECDKDKTINIPGNAIIISEGRNTYQFEARRFASQYCNGKYTWFVDADDEVMSIKEEHIKNINKEDVVIFNTLSNDDTAHLEEPFFIRKRILNNCDYKSGTLSSFLKNCKLDNKWDFVGCTLWNKWIRTEFLKELMSDIPKDKEIVASEDIFYSAYFVTKSSKIILLPYIMYCYNINNSTCCANDVTIDRFMHITKGYLDAEELFMKKIRDYKKWDNSNNNAAFFLVKASKSKETEKCIKHLSNIFSKEDLVNNLEHPWLKGLKTEEKLRLFTLIENAYKGEKNDY